MRRTLVSLVASALVCVVPAVGGPAYAAADTPPASASALATAPAPAANRAPSSPAPSRWQARPATYGVAKTSNVAITMSDGVVLYADVYRPAGPDGKPAAGTFPVVLTQNPYNKSTPVLGFSNTYLVKRGYVDVVVDVRGTGSSHGTWSSFGKREQRDGYELVRWAHSRAWSNGKVALWGASYMAINQFFTAAQHPPGLKALFPIVPAGDVYR
ncbi:MAG: CocE/NonD family hydrolase, partial [Nocardioidaceae bacterium]